MASNFPRNLKTYGAIRDDTERLLSPNHFTDTAEVTATENGTGALNGRNTDRDYDLEGGDDELSGMAVVKKQVKECCSQTFTLQTVRNTFPIAKWLPKYSFGSLQADMIAGFTVGLTVIPQGLAYAQIANLPPQYGLYTAFMGCFVYCILGSSKDITLGPTAVMSLMTATFGTDLYPEIISEDKGRTMAVILTFMSGVIQLSTGILRLGMLVNFISYPVINAFTSAAAITIACGQVKNLLGLKKIASDFVPMVYDTLSKLPETRVWDLTMGLVALVLLMLLKHLRTKKWKDDPDTKPSLLVIICRKVIWLVGTGGNAIVVISAAGVAAALESQGLADAVSVTGDIKPGMPPFEPPKFELTDGNVTIPSSEVLAKIGPGLAIVPLISLVETIAIGKAFARTNNYKLDATQELVAVGVANMMSSFVSSYPITGSFSRTAVNSQTGVRTPLGGIFTGGLVILALCVLTPWFYYIPKSALAAVIITAVLQMVDCRIIVTLWKANKWDLASLVVTFICSLVVGIEYGILIGIGASILLLLYPVARPKIKYTRKPGLLIITPIQGLNFPGAEYLEDKALEKAMAADENCNVVLNMEHLSDMDYTAVLSIKSLHADCQKHGIKLILTNGVPRVIELLNAGNIKDLRVRKSLQEAIDEFSIQATLAKPE
uniref:STAS domain-containing protein n=1 Tax=Arion vulgaris TaxID=1028688 RepID=A0A0B7AJE2_9EUPU